MLDKVLSVSPHMLFAVVILFLGAAMAFDGIVHKDWILAGCGVVFGGAMSALVFIPARKIFLQGQEKQEPPPEGSPEGLAWTRLKGGMLSQKWVEATDGSMQIYPTLAASANSILLCLFFGWLMLSQIEQSSTHLVDFFSHIDSAKTTPWKDIAWAVLIPLALFSFIHQLLDLLGRIIFRSTFDVKNQMCRRIGDKRQTLPFSDVLGLQIIKGYGSLSSDSYQLNLVLNDRSRIPLMKSSNLPQALVDAQKLSKVLNVPVWRQVQL